jgi:hypothetical protein
MLDFVKQLFENNVISEEMKSEIENRLARQNSRKSRSSHS